MDNPTLSTLPICEYFLSKYLLWRLQGSHQPGVSALLPCGPCGYGCAGQEPQPGLVSSVSQRGFSLSVSLLQGGPGHLYLLKNKVATFAKVEKEEDMIL